MDALGRGDVFLFEGFRLDPRGGGLFRRDERGTFVPVVISSRALGILGVLVERPGDLVSRDAIITAVWPTTVVEDNNLSTQIAALRRVLDQGRGEASCIQTVSGRGYRFLGPVTRVDPTPSSQSTRLPAMGASGQLSRTSNCTIPAFWVRSMPRLPHRHCERGTGSGAPSRPRSSAAWAS
jgi:DNA-binding winged helix-turn-helix (wHTH) protein